MTTTRKHFSFWVYDKEIRLREFLETKVNVSDYVKDILEKVMNGKLIETKSMDLQRKKLEVDIRYKEIMIKIKEKELIYNETFDETPSSRAKIAIKTGVNTESFNPPEEKKLNEIIKLNWNRFIDSLKQNSKGEWISTCKLCSTGFILPTKEQSINRFKIHLEENHQESVLH